MWILFAFGSALFAGLTSILAKCGIKNTDSNAATAIRTIIVLIFSWIMVFLVGAQHSIGNVSVKTWTFLILSGLATGASWLCYFRALQIGDVDKVVPVDKSSAILSILLAFLFLHESISPLKLLCVVLIGAGTYLMITKKETSSENSGKKGWSWFFYALGSAVFASLTSILGKVGIENIDSNLGTAIRTIVVLIMAWIVVYNRLNTRSEAAATGVNASFTAPPNKISRVEITLSFAITPLINEVQILQSPSPSGAKIGTRQFEIIARILSLESATRLKCKSNFCKNQIQIVATKITVNAFCRKSFAFSHKSCITFFSPGRR